MNEVHCSGNEENLTECRRDGIGTHNCVEKYEEAGVICYGIFQFLIIICVGPLSNSDHSCNDSDIRLVDGETEREGRLEICINGIWGSVCNRRWDVRDARVVCRQLGYNGCKLFS